MRIICKEILSHLNAPNYYKISSDSKEAIFSEKWYHAFKGKLNRMLNHNAHFYWPLDK